MGIHELLINLLVVLVSILFIQYWVNRRDVKRIQFELILFTSFSVAILICMMFPITINSGFLLDLRLIPFLLACFYASRYSIIGLALVIIIIRSFMGGSGIWVNLLLTPIILLLTIYLRPHFQRSRIRIKLLIPTILIGLISVLILLLAKIKLPDAVPDELWFSFIGIQMVGMILATYMAETIRSQQVLLLKLVRMEKLEIVSHLAASIAHEVRNPLTSSRGFLQLGRESEKIPPQEKEYLSLALSEMDRAEGIIQDYLAFAKPVNEKMSTFAIQDVVKEVIKIIQPLAKVHSIHFISELEQPQFIQGNVGHFQQVMINIIKNSIEAMPDGGTIEIKMEEENDHVLLKVNDQGIGMTRTQIQRLGEPYFSTKDNNGTGLGMMVVFRVIESMNGKISVKSKVGKGTEISLRLPLDNTT